MSKILLIDSKRKSVLDKGIKGELMLEGQLIIYPT